MNPTIDRLKIVFLALFAVGAVAIWGYQIFYVWPAQKCDARAGWWDFKGRVCATPIYISSITGRPAGMSRKAWSELQAARQVQREREGYPAGGAAAAPAPEAADAASAVTPPAKK
ncbi:MAG: hypothetical protein HY859_11010 [Caulobacterales bacterium]|nr:hypothetical protein [Caulobacterales bacterium]